MRRADVIILCALIGTGSNVTASKHDAAAASDAPPEERRKSRRGSSSVSLKENSLLKHGESDPKHCELLSSDEEAEQNGNRGHAARSGGGRMLLSRALTRGALNAAAEARGEPGIDEFAPQSDLAV